LRISSLVARRARAWIETIHHRNHLAAAASPAARGRGLKLLPPATIGQHQRSPAARGRGLKRYVKRVKTPAKRRPPRAGVD